MRQFEKWWLGLGLAGALFLWATQPTRAEGITDSRAEEALSSVPIAEVGEDEEDLASYSPASNPVHPVSLTEIPHLNELENPATTVGEWLAQLTIQITDVQLNPTENGIEIVLETTEGQLPIPSTSVTGNALIADIPNAVLTLPDGDEFQAANPAEGIALVSVTSLPNNRVRVAITGLDAPPTTEVRTVEQGLVVSVTPGAEGTADTEEDAIQVVVTGEQEDGYRVEDATTATRTDTPVRDIPQSISVIPRQVLEDQGGTRLGDALRNVPGATNFGESSRSLFDTFIIRGFSTPNTLRNGLREGNSFSFNQSLGSETANIDRIEVLRGPASVLYGRGGLGGTVNIVTEQPLSEPFYEVEGTVGSYALYRGSGSSALDMGKSS